VPPPPVYYEAETTTTTTTYNQFPKTGDKPASNYGFFYDEEGNPLK